MNKTIRTLLIISLVGASKLALADSEEMTVSQAVAYEGFSGKLQYHNESPTAEQIAENCSNNSNLISSSFPKTMPPRKPRERSSDQYSMKFKHTTSIDDFSCGVPLTTVIGWNYKGVSHQCYVTVLLGGGGQNELYTTQYKKIHLCTISGDCYSDDCSPDNDSGGKLWRIKPKM